MPNYNKVLLMGHVTRDPTLSYLPSQTAVVELGIAVNRRWKSKEGEAREEVCFVDCRAYGKQAETLNQYVKKGNPILLEGRLQLDTWEDKSGQKRSKHRVIIEGFQFLGSADKPTKEAEPDTAGQSTAGPAPPASMPESGNMDDIPF